MAAHLNHRQLEAFRAVMQMGTVTSAASVLSISQPAVSRLLGDLESALKIHLFKRDKGRLIPTHEAQTLYKEVERSFVGLDAITRLAERLRDYRSGTLRLATMPALALSYLPLVTHRFLQSHPGVTLDLQVLPSLTVEHWVVTQRIEVGFVAQWRVDQAIASESLLTAPLLAVLPPDFEIPDDGIIRPQHLKDLPFISLEMGLRTRFAIDQVFAKADIARLNVVETSMTHVACKLVAQGTGVTLVDPLAALSFREYGVKVAPFAPDITFDYHILYSAQSPPSLLAQHFVTHVRREVTTILDAANVPYQLPGVDIFSPRPPQSSI